MNTNYGVILVSWLSMMVGSVFSDEGTNKLSLVVNSKPVSSIVLADEPTRSAQLAAYELQWHIKEMTRATIPILRTGEKVEGVKILVGDSSLTRKLGYKNKDFKSQEYIIKFLPDTLILMGRDKEERGIVRYGETDLTADKTWPDYFDEQGTMYAVYNFLERYCGVRWYNPTDYGMDCPKKDTLTAGGNEIRRMPFFKYRHAVFSKGWHDWDYYYRTELWHPESKGCAEYDNYAYSKLRKRVTNDSDYREAKCCARGLFWRRMRAGGEKWFGSHSFYGYYERFWERGSFSRLFPWISHPDVFVEKRPEWFAKGYDGRPPQLCYTNPEVISRVVEDIKDYFDGNGEDYFKYTPKSMEQSELLTNRHDSWGENCFGLVPMDNVDYCKCSKCQKLIRPQDEGYINHFFSSGIGSEYWYNFVNIVAKEIKKSHPDKWILACPYWGYAKYPETVKLESNIAVEFCFVSNRLVYDRSSYEHELKYLKEWVTKEKDRPIYLWLYYTFPHETAALENWYCFPGFFAHKIDEQFKLFHRYGIKGMFHCGYGQDVESYVTFKLMDDPTLDIEKLLDDYFYRLYGGKAGEVMKRLYCAIEEAYCNPANWPGKKGEIPRMTEEHAWGYIGTEERMNKFGKLLQEAKKLAKTDIEKNRIELFEKSIWNYMLAGMAQYLSKRR